MNIFWFDLCKYKNISNKPKIFCNAKCIYKYLVKKVKMKKFNQLEYMDTV